jgi:Bacterial Ig-like domain
MTSLLNPKPVCRSHLNTNSFKRAPKVAASWLARISVSLVFIAACLATFATPAAAQADITEFRQAAPTLSTNGGCIAASPTTWQILTRFVGVTNDSGGGDYVDVYLVDGTGLILSRDGVWIPNLVTTYNFTMAGTTTVNPVASPFRMVIYDNISLATRLAVGTNISAAIYPLLADITFNPYASDPDCPFYDSVAPVLTAFGRNTPTTQITNADTLIFDITFNESVTGADVSDFAITGTTATASGALAGSGSSYRLTIAGGDLASFNGTVGLNLNTGHGITDIAGNALPNIDPATDLTFTLDNTAPSGYSASIDAAIINAANASSVSFSFSGAEIGAAFIYSLTDNLAASVTGAGTVSSATQNVSGIDVGALNDGDITLSVTLTDTASNAGSAAAAAAVSKDTTPPSGYTFVIDQDPINSGNVGAVSVTFAGLEVGASYTYSLSSSGGGTSLSGSGTALIAGGTLPGADASGLADGTITASITLTDAAGNAGSAVTDTVTKETVAPRIASIIRQTPSVPSTNADSLTWRVTFDSAVTNITNDDFTATGTTGTVTSVTNPTGNDYDVTVSGGDLAGLDGTVTLGFSGGQNIADWAGNALSNTTPTGANEPGYSVNNQTPTIAAITRQVPTTERTNADTLVWDISFSHISPLLSLNPGDFNLIGTTATLSLERYSTGFIATATGGDLAALNGVVSLFLGDGPNSDEFGNVVNPSPTGVTETFTVDNTPPAGYSFTIDQDPINTGNVGAVSVSFTGLELGTGYAYSISSSGGGAPITGMGAVAAASGSLPGADVSGLADGTITASITLTDAAGNTGSAVTDTALKDTVAPSGYSFTIDQDPINIGNVGAVSVSFTGLEVGASYTYSLSSSGGGTPLTSSGTVLAASGTLPGADASGLADGTITASITLTDAAGNTGAAATDTATKDTVAPTLAITGPTGIVGGPFTVTLTFSEDVIGFGLEDFIIYRNSSGSGGGAVLSGGATNLQAVSAREYTATITPVTSGYHVVGVGSGAAADAAGNGNASSTPYPFAVLADLRRPTVSITSTTPTVGTSNGANGPIDIVVTFSENVIDFTVNDIEVIRYTNGSGTNETSRLSNFQAVSASVYTATLTPNPAVDGLYEFDILAGVATDLAGNPNDEFSLTYQRRVDITRPSVSISQLISAANAPFVLRIVFNEAMTADFGLDDFSIGNGTASNLVDVSGVGQNNGFDVTITPTAEGPVTIDIPENGATDRFELGNTAAAQLIVDYDITPPSVAIATPAGSVSGAFTTTFAFSEDVTGFALDDITVGNGVASNRQAISASVYTATITPVADGIVTLGVSGARVLDLAGNDNTAAPPFSVINDQTAPTLAITGPTGPVNGAFATTFTFSENVEGFALDDLVVANGAASNFQIASPGCSGTSEILAAACSELSGFDSVASRVYMATITPVADGLVTVDVAGSAAQDVAGNASPVASQYSVSNDQTAPTGYTFVIDQDPITSANVGAVSLTFSGFEPGSSYSYSLSSSAGGTPITGSGSVVIAGGTLPPLDISALADGVFTASVTLTDTAGNAGPAATDTATKDTTGPTLSITGPAGLVSGAFDLLMVFSDPIEDVAFVDDPFTLTNGSFGDSAPVDAVTIRQQVIPDADGLVAIVVNANAFTDALGNLNAAGIPYSVINDETRPSLVITGPSLPVNTPPVVTFTFDEDVTGFTVEDVSILGGTASAFNVISARIYTASINLDPGFAAARSGGVDSPQFGGGGVQIDVRVDAAAAIDAVGQSNTTSNSFPVFYDTFSPVAFIGTSVAASAGPFTVSFTFDEAITGFAVDDIVVANGALTNFAQTYDCGDPLGVQTGNCEIAAEFEALITPSLEGAVTIDVPANAFIDLAGNASRASSRKTVPYDTVSPTIAIGGPVGPIAGPFTATMTFSEDVSGFVLADITVGNATISNFQAPSATLFNGQFTPTDVFTATIAPVTDGPVTLDVAANVAIDGAGNSNLAALQFSTDFDGTGPTATITAPSGFDTLDPFVVTILFDEPVLFFTDVGEVTATHANVTAPSGSGTTYTATVTPDGNGDVEIGVLAQAALDLTLVNYNAAATPVVVKDVIAPNVVLASTASGTITGDVIVSASFTEAVADLTQSDFVITNGTASNFQQLTLGIYFILVTPAADGLVSVDLPAGAARDGLGNLSTAATPFSINADVTRPVPRFVNAPTAINSTAPFNVTVEFTEPVFFFTDVGEVAAFNASVSAPVGTGTTYVVTVTPNSGGNIYLAVIEGAALDGTFVNSNTGVSTSIAFDNTDPRLASVERLNPLTETTNADALTWRIRFDGTVQNVDAADFAVAGTSGSITSVTGSGKTFEVTASGGDLGFMDGVVALSLSAGQNITDTAGNALTNTAPTGAAASYTLKNSAPTLVIATTTAAPVLEAFPLTFTFNEDVTGFALSDISATNATIGQFQAVSATSYMAVATPTADGTITISVTAFSAEDALNNGNTDASLSIESRAIRPPAGTISALVAPGARSGHFGGPQLTVSAFVTNSGTNPVADCSVLIPTSAPVTMSWQQVDGSLNPVGAANASFDLPVGASASLILTLTPTSVTPLTGYTMYPQFLCRNASADPITGVNTLFLAISATPPPDILSSGATVSGDGVIRIPSSGSVGFLSAAAVNIGGGDDSAGLNDVTVTVTADTGSISIPVTLEVCETHPVTGVCLAPRSASTTGTWSQNENRFFAVFVRDASGGAGIPLDAANSRVYLRFTDATGTLRSITSAAVTAPAAAGVTPPLSALPTGRWSVLVRAADGVWPSLTPSVLHVGPDGLGILDDGVSPRTITMTPMTSDGGPTRLIGQFGSDGATGFWHAAGVIRQGDALASDAGDFWGARDVRSDTTLNWHDLAGDYGNGVFITEAGEIRGHLGGCSVYGAASGRAARPVALTLSGCETSGSYTAVLDLPANDNDTAVLLVAGQNSGWRLER